MIIYTLRFCYIASFKFLIIAWANSPGFQCLHNIILNIEKKAMHTSACQLIFELNCSYGVTEAYSSSPGSYQWMVLISLQCMELGITDRNSLKFIHRTTYRVYFRGVRGCFRPLPRDRFAPTWQLAFPIFNMGLPPPPLGFGFAPS